MSAGLSPALRITVTFHGEGVITRIMSTFFCIFNRPNLCDLRISDIDGKLLIVHLANAIKTLAHVSSLSVWSLTLTVRG